VKRWSIVFPNIRSSFAAALLAVLAILCADVARGQTFNLENDRVQMAELHGMWRFHTGDDPDSELGWADPGFNDSSWSLLLADQPWAYKATRDTAAWLGIGSRYSCVQNSELGSLTGPPEGESSPVR
jgi:hypothetical protein